MELVKVKRDPSFINIYLIIVLLKWIIFRLLFRKSSKKLYPWRDF